MEKRSHRAEFNIGVDVQEMINDLPVGLDRAILDVLKFHQGRDNAISRIELLANLAMIGFRLKDDRPVRMCINQLRKKGAEICSTGGEDGGYWLGSGKDEVFEFTQNEYRSRAMDMLETAKAMEEAAEKKWGRYSPEKQISIF